MTFDLLWSLKMDSSPKTWNTHEDKPKPQRRKFRVDERRKTHPPILYSPTPPFQARTNEGSANKETGLKDPVAKYGPTGPRMTKIIALPGRDTPRDGWMRGEGGVRSRKSERQVGFSSRAHLGSDEGGPDVEAGALRVRDPVLVHLHQLLDALQQLTFIKQLKEAPQTDRFVTKNTSQSVLFVLLLNKPGH